MFISLTNKTISKVISKNRVGPLLATRNSVQNKNINKDILIPLCFCLLIMLLKTNNIPTII